MPSPYLCEHFHPTRGCVSLNFRPETTFFKVVGRVRTADLQTRRLPLNPLLTKLNSDRNNGLRKQMALSNIPKSFTLSYLVTLWSWAFNQVNMFAEGQHTYYSCPISLKAKNRNVIGQLRISGGAGIYYVFHCGRSLSNVVVLTIFYSFRTLPFPSN